jgi:NTP pyrophosphatase (non-canonical NTP hydrolase)
VNASDYQRLASRTLVDRSGPYTAHELGLVKAAIRLSAAAGDIAEYVKKGVFHEKGLVRNNLEMLLDEVAAAAAVLEARNVHPASNKPTQLDIDLLWNAIGLSGESGEVAQFVYDIVFNGAEFNLATLEKELGDVEWYTAALCTKTGLNLGRVMEKNIEKLKARYPHGWDADRSHAAGTTPAEESA